MGLAVAGTPAVAAAAPARPTPHPGPIPRSAAQPPGLTPFKDGYGPTPDQQAAMVTAAARARSTGKPVTVDSLTTETAQFSAQPKGGFVVQGNPEPVRANQNGKWVPVDTTLHRNADGSLSPAATAYGSVSLSGGGQIPLATTNSGSTTYSVSWPTTLPTPTVEGSKATYHDVLPGVDLQASATIAGGFAEVLVVHDAKAAANPALTELQLPAKVTGGTVTSTDTGGITVTGASGGNTLEASTPFMWDSNTAVPAQAKNKAQLAPDASDTSHAGLAAHLAPVAAKATGAGLTLRPDKHLLTDRGTVFPVYIDPSFQWKSPPDNMSSPAFAEVKQGRPCTASSFYNDLSDRGDDGNLAVGVMDFPGYSCQGLMRTFYQWTLPQVIWGAHIGNVPGQPGATVNVTKVYSGTCATGTVNLHWSGGIRAGTSWNSQPSYGPSIAQASFGPADRPGCAGNQQRQYGGFDVTNAIAQSAAAHAPQITFALVDDNGERTHSDAGYSRYLYNPTLQIFFNRAPNTPGANQLAARAGSDNAGCATSGQYPYMGKTIATNTPVLSTQVLDADGDHLQARFQYGVDGSTQTTSVSTDELPSGGTAEFSLPNSFITGLSNGQVVDWRVQVTDGMDWSDWSPTCHFIAEPTAPSSPSIVSTDGRFPSDGRVGAVSGQPGRFTVSSTGGQVSTLMKGLDQPPPTDHPSGGGAMAFNGGSAVGPAGWWPLDDTAFTTKTTREKTANVPTTLFGSYSQDSDLVRGKSLKVDAAGFAATSGPMIKTDGSFTAAAWVKGTSTTDNGVALGQDSIFASGFYLENIDGKWSFSRLASDTANAPALRAESTSPPQPGVWTHLAGVYDAASGKMTLYVNGQAQGSAIDSTPYAGTGAFTIGRGQWNAAQGGDFRGSISGVQAYQAALSPADIGKLTADTAVAPTARWRTTEGAGTSLADASGNNHPMTLTGGGVGWTQAKEDTPAVTFADPNGYGTTSGPVLDTTQSFTVSAWAKVNDLAGYYAVVGQNATHVSAFQIRYSPDVKAWIFGMPTVDATGDHYQWAFKDNSVSQAGVWTHVAGVYDASAHQISLYVNGVLLAQKSITSVIPASGPFLVGATIFNDGGAAFMHGAISDVQAYQTALGASEIAEIHASATAAITPSYPGPHTVWGYTVGPAGDASSTQAYPFVAAQDPTITCASLAACFNNTAISPDSNRAVGNADGGNSFSANDLDTAGWKSGQTVTVNGATFTLPQYGSGQADNVLAANQTITYNQKVSSTGTSALEFLTTATVANNSSPGAFKGNTTAPYVPAGTPVASSFCFNSDDPAAWCAPQGTIHYSDGTPQPFYLVAPDWVNGPDSLAAVTLPHRNEQSSQNGQLHPKIFAFSVPVLPGKTIASVQLPDVSTSAAGVQALHIFGMATRDTTVVGAPAGKTWTGAWSSPTEGVFNYGSTFRDVTFREAVKPSISGNTVRIKLDNALGVTRLDIDHATIALDNANQTPTEVPDGVPVDLTFDAHKALSLPEGGMAYSDPVSLAVAANQYVLVSIHIADEVPFMPMHTDANDTGYEYVTTGSGDNTSDTTGLPFSQNGFGDTSTAVVTGLDVATDGVATQAVLGDGYLDQAQTGKRPPALTNLAGVFTAAEASTPLPSGSLAEGIESNQVMADYPEANGSGPSLLSRVDRDLLDQPGLSTAVLDEGLEDVLAGRSAQDLYQNGLSTLIGYLKNQGVALVAMGLTPCDGYTGDGASHNDACTADVDKARVAANKFLAAGAQTNDNWYYVDSDAAVGVPDTANGEVKLDPNADGGDHVNMTDAGFGALASAYLAAQDTWKLNDGATTLDPTTAADSASNLSNPYLASNPLTGQGVANLEGGASWAADDILGNVLSLNGMSSDAVDTNGSAFTGGSFSVSAWVRLTGTGQDADIVSQDGSQRSGVELQYNKRDNRWEFVIATTDPSDDGTKRIDSDEAPTPGLWTHLVGTYDTSTKQSRMYVNGQRQVGNWVINAPVLGTGSLVMGRGQANGAPANYFPGSLSTVQAWDYALTPAQVAGLYKRIS